MARWEPDARGRLESAAMELFVERGYAQTTVADIAERAGVTERTFFRHFADKREVLFSGSALFEEGIVASVAEGLATAHTSGDATPFAIVASAFVQAGERLQAMRDRKFVKARWAMLLEHPELRERELIKMASIGAAVTQALRKHGVEEPAASLIADLGISALKVGFERWMESKKASDLGAHIQEAVDALQVLTSAPAQAVARASRPRTRR